MNQPRKEHVTPTPEAMAISTAQPPGTLLLADFAARIGIDKNELLEHVQRHGLEHSIVPTSRPNEYKRYFDKTQREAVIRYLDEQGIEHK